MGPVAQSIAQEVLPNGVVISRMSFLMINLYLGQWTMGFSFFFLLCNWFLASILIRRKDAFISHAFSTTCTTTPLSDQKAPPWKSPSTLRNQVNFALPEKQNKNLFLMFYASLTKPQYCKGSNVSNKKEYFLGSLEDRVTAEMRSEGIAFMQGLPWKCSKGVWVDSCPTVLPHPLLPA